ncbi:DHA2 family efflux MFS transporter permease subunit [Actinomadura sp. NPDC047616]|uniref:DHA2 family efflux MFS transporter permease subunit n=1 Tax=Actinomadura sp. NPDC047616 TaxID=3155914 RepID=UPI0033F1EE0C
MSSNSDDAMDPALLRLVAVVLLGGMMGLLDGTVVAVGVETLATAFDASLSTTGWVATGYLLAVTVSVALTAWSVDRFGDRRMWLFALVLFLAGSVASGLAWNIGSLIVFRVVQGLAAGMLDPLMLALLARAAGPARAGRVMGLMGVVLSLGPALGPIVGGTLIQALDWRWMFLINVPIGVVAFLGALRLVPADAPREQRPAVRLDVLGLALVGPGFAAVVLALSQTAEQATFAVWPVLVPLAAGAVLLAGYGVHALRARRTPPLIDLRLFLHPSFAASVAVMTSMGVVMFSMLFVLPLYYQRMHGHGVLMAGVLVASYGLGATLSMPVAGRVSDRVGARRLALGGAAIALVSILALTQMGARTPEAWTASAVLALGLGAGAVGAPTMGSLYRTLPAASVSQGTSALYMLNQVGGSLGVAVSALILETADEPMAGFHGAYRWVTGAVVVMLALSVLLPGPPRARVSAQTSEPEREAAA